MLPEPVKLLPVNTAICNSDCEAGAHAVISMQLLPATEWFNRALYVFLFSGTHRILWPQENLNYHLMTLVSIY